jgi:hypothetical protein
MAAAWLHEELEAELLFGESPLEDAAENKATVVAIADLGNRFVVVLEKRVLRERAQAQPFIDS